MLTELGHTVEEAGDAEAALAMLEGGRFDVVVTDLSLPGMSGEALAERARERDPDLGVVFATGYAAAERKRGSTALEERGRSAKAVRRKRPGGRAEGRDQKDRAAQGVRRGR